MAVSLDPRLALIQILKTTQQALCTLKMKGDQQKVHKATKVKLFQETAVCIFISVGWAISCSLLIALKFSS